MRVIITPQANDLIQEIKKEQLKVRDSTPTNNLFSKTEKLTFSMRKSTSQICLKSKSITNLPIKTKKVTMFQSDFNKYNKIDYKNSFLPSLPFKISRRLDNSLNSKNYSIPAKEMNNNYVMPVKLKDILNEDTTKLLRKDLKSKKECRLKNTVIKNVKDEMYKDNDCELDELLNFNIGSSKVNLVNYLNNKSTISEKFLKKISSLYEDKLYKADLNCQKIFTNNNEFKERKKIFEIRFKESKSPSLLECNKTTSKIESILDNIKDVTNEYKIEEKSRDVYNERYSNIKDLWKKHNVDRLNKKFRKRDISSIINNIKIN